MQNEKKRRERDDGACAFKLKLFSFALKGGGC